MEGTRHVNLAPGMRLGMGVLSAVEQTRGQVVEYTGQQPSTSGAQSPDAEFSMVSDEKTLTEKMNVSVAASVNLGLYGGGDAKFDMLKEHASHDLAITLLLRVVLAQQPRTMTGMKVVEAAAALYAKDPDEFLRRYGDSYVDEVGGGGEFYGLLIFEAHDESSHTNIAASMNAHVGNAITGGSLNASFQNDIAEATKHASLSIWSHWSGGQGLQNPATIDELMDLYRHFNAAVAANPWDFWATIKDIRTLPLPPQPGWVEQTVRSDCVQTCGERVLELIALRKKVDFILDNPNQFDGLDEKKKQDLSAARDAAEKLLPKLAQTAVDCAEDLTKCSTAGLDTPQVDWPPRRGVVDPLAWKLDSLRHDSRAKVCFLDAMAPPGGTEDYDSDQTRPGGRYVLFHDLKTQQPVSGIFHHPDVDYGQPHVVYGGIFGEYASRGLCDGVLGYPVTDEEPVRVGDSGAPPGSVPGRDRVSAFERGSIYWSDAGATAYTHVLPNYLTNNEIKQVARHLPPGLFDAPTP